jgi:hypothetical protein
MAMKMPDANKTILLPQIRSIEYFPPVITWINYLCSKGFYFILLAHKIDRSSYQFPDQIRFIEITGKAYPKSLPGKLLLKVKSALALFSVLKEFSFALVWVCVWDFKYLKYLLRFSGFQGKIVYQFLELDPSNFPYCKYADHIIVPEENRAWLTYFLAKLPEKPWYLPNIPLIPSFSVSEIPATLQHLQAGNKIIIFYSGLIDFYSRCLDELMSALLLLDNRYCLVIMPGRNPDQTLIRKVESNAKNIGVGERVFLIDSMPAPMHLSVLRYASVGIGLYRPSSLNQVYAAPNRIYEFTAFGVPVILPDFPQFSGLAHKYPGGIVTVDPENVQDIAAKLRLLGEPGALDKARLEADRYFTENGEYEKFASVIARKLFPDSFKPD